MADNMAVAVEPKRSPALVRQTIEIHDLVQRAHDRVNNLEESLFGNDGSANPHGEAPLGVEQVVNETHQLLEHLVTRIESVTSRLHQ